MKEVFTAFLDSAKERIKTPFVGTFVFAWLVFNWKPLLIFIFSKYGIEARINMISLDYSDPLINLLWPFCLAVGYMVLVPLISLAFDWLMKKIHFLRKGIKNSYKLEGQYLRHEYVSTGLDYRIEDAEKEIQLEDIKLDYKEKSSLSKKIKSLEDQILTKKKITEDIEKLLQTSENNKNELTESFNETKIHFNEFQKIETDLSYIPALFLKYKSSSENYYSFIQIAELISEKGFVLSLSDNIFKTLFIDDKLIMSKNDPDDKTTYVLTNKGFLFWKSYLRDKELAIQNGIL